MKTHSNPATRPKHADPAKAEAFVASLSPERVAAYETYFQSLKPMDEHDVFRRALFAFASVHTTWKSNCALYTQLYDLAWMKDKQLLLFRLTESGAGLHNNRMKFLWDFAQRYWAHPGWYRKQPYEDWFGFRDRLNKNVKGLGLAKAAFFQELTYFEANEAACMDVHLIKLFGLPAKTYGVSGASEPFVKYCEQAWASMCLNVHVSPTTARWCYWDTKQNKPDSRYWSYVLEGPPVNPFSQQLLLFPTETLVATVRVPEDTKKQSDTPTYRTAVNPKAA
jgi:thermostable 8-oxoguanine DNA glycosylase